MVESARVALLARAGNARDQLRRALSELGVELVAEGDPAELDPVSVANQLPTLIVVSLDAAIQAALEPFNSLLAEPGIEVIYDDAEVTNKLEGWDLNRWARHLAVKLVGSQELLFPSHEESVLPSDFPEPVALMDEVLFYHSDEGARVDPTLGETQSDIDSSFDSFGFYSEQQQENFVDANVEALAANLDAFEKIDSRVIAQDLDFSIPKDFNGQREEPFNRASDFKEESTGNVAATNSAKLDFSNLTLEDFDGAAPISSVQTTGKFTHIPDTTHLSLEPLDDLSPKSSKDKNFTLTSNSPGMLDNTPVTLLPQHAMPGALVILAGLGGPDSVRQLLANLPNYLPVPVLLYQHLETGKQERLVEQLAKVSRLPVLLAENDAMTQHGMVNVLPTGLAVVAEGAVLHFAAGTLLRLLSELSPTDTVVVVLSGADVGLVSTLLSMEIKGTLILAQDPDSCLEPAAVNGLHHQGVHTYPVLGLARQIAARWPLTSIGEQE